MLEALKQKLSNKINNTIDSIKVSEEERTKRFDICKSCENLNRMDFCNICSCYMPAKTYLPNTSCPIKKWLPIENAK